jgi:hypothetical protein
MGKRNGTMNSPLKLAGFKFIKKGEITLSAASIIFYLDAILPITIIRPRQISAQYPHLLFTYSLFIVIIKYYE